MTTSLLRRHRNPPCHVRMKTAEIVHAARMVQRNPAYSLPLVSPRPNPCFAPSPCARQSRCSSIRSCRHRPPPFQRLGDPLRMLFVTLKYLQTRLEKTLQFCVANFDDDVFCDSRGESGMIHRTPTESQGRGQCRQRWTRTIGRTRLRCFAPACRVVGGRLRTIAASSRRCISSPSRTFAGALCRSASVIGTACGSASIA